MRPSRAMGAVAALVAAFTACSQPSRNRLIVLSHRVWQVSLEGRIAPVPFLFPSAYDDNLLGSTAPLPSPDGRWIAFGEFTGDCDIHLLDVRSLQQRRITWVGRPARKGYTYADALLDGWSPDSKELLFAVAPGETTSDSGELRVPNADYGFYVYTLATGVARRVELPKGFQFVAWLPDGRLLGTVPGPGPCDERLFTFTTKDARGADVGTPFATALQVKASDDGRRVVGMFGTGKCGERQSRGLQIARIELSTRKLTVVAPVTAALHNPWPALSPRGEHISYKREDRMVKGIPHEALFVDGKSLYSCQGPIDYAWVDKQSIAATCQDQVLVLDSTTGEIKGRHSLAAAYER